MSLFTYINFVNSLAKIYVSCCRERASNVADSFINIDRYKKKLTNFWKCFIIDFFLYQLPVIFYITIFNSTVANYVLFSLFALFFYKLIRRNKIIFIQNEINETLNGLDLSREFTLNNIDIKVVKLGVNSFRTMLFIITSVAILAVDFRLFPRHHRKTVDFGFSLMDVGVGFFIMCHSMRLIRNSVDEGEVSIDSSFKK